MLLPRLRAGMPAAVMLDQGLMTMLGSAALWSMWVLCILLILPVLLNVPGKPTAWELTLYFAVLGAVVAYAVLLPMLTGLKAWARYRSQPALLALLQVGTWVIFAVVALILLTLAGAFYAHEQARPVLSEEERFSNSYANAILRQDTAWMDRLMAQGAHVDHPMTLGRTPALMSAAFGDWSLVAFLLERGADPDRTDDQGRSVRTLATTPVALPRDATESLALERVRMILGNR